MNRRLLELREQLGISQQEFGEKIGVSRFSISNYEAGNRTITDRVVADICREFNINEAWLRYGTGNMYTEPNEKAIFELAKKIGLDDDMAKSLQSFHRLNPENKIIVKEYIKSLISAYNTKEQQEG